MHIVSVRKLRLVLAATSALPGTLLAANISLDFSTLPSDQGWEYSSYGNTASEQSVFFATGSSLISDSIGIGFQATGSQNLYFLPDVVDESLPFSLNLRVRVTEEERISGTDNPFGFSFGVTTSIYSFGFGLGVNDLATAFEEFMPIGDNTVFRDFHLNANPVTGEYTLLADGTPLLSDVATSRNPYTSGTDHGFPSDE